MHVAPGEIAEHFLRFLVESITGPGVRREDWNRNDVTHRRNARDKDLARVSSGIKKIVFILLAGGDVAGEGVRRSIAFACAAAFSAAHKGDGRNDDRKRDRGFGFHVWSFCL